MEVLVMTKILHVSCAGNVNSSECICDHGRSVGLGIVYDVYTKGSLIS